MRAPTRASLSACVWNNTAQASPGLARERSRPRRGVLREMPDTNPQAGILEPGKPLLAEWSTFELLKFVSLAIHTVKAVLNFCLVSRPRHSRRSAATNWAWVQAPFLAWRREF